ncbi:MAG: DEAD/DEAH box helicase [Deltaproteobacteria bacterium HGW-Deltaproteobacteria-12]|jgi:type I restriction enzyme R subunit|nr:MAG: DEAD/DEAH box helicase [Deltaproteobacteria bacterium HGW-Deltaproteobacteria-12]
MTPKGYTEDTLIEQPAITLLAELGWETFNAYNEFDHGASPLGRETKAEVVLKTRLREILLRINPEVSVDSIHQAIEELTRDRSRMSAVAANREIYHLLKNGVRISIPDPEGDGETVEVVRVIDWDEPANNNFLLCSQFWITGEMHTRRADLIGFVNGLPLLFIELKAAHRRLETAFTGNLRDYKDTVPHLFWPNALIILSNGSQSRVGSVTAGWEHFAEWKKIGSEDEAGRVSLETMLRGVCEPARILDLVENFCLYQEVPGGLIKLTAKNHQYLGVNNALTALADIRQRDGKLGVFWHTQGSGKSVSMIFFAQKVLRKLPGNWTFVVVTDRQELDGQIYKNFASAGVVTEGRAQAESSKHLRQLLTEDHRYIFTLIHKFRIPEEVSTRNDIIVITDEAHRTQYDTLALNMRTALPKASFLAFTGTPLIVSEEKTRQVFGDYISVYDFQQSVDDGSTVRLYYENRIPELQLVNENLNEDMERLLEEAELDDTQEKKLEREFTREYHLITREDRLEAVAKDVVAHFTGRGFQGKAMMICIDKATAVRMYDKVKKHWGEKIIALQAEWNGAEDDPRLEIEERIARMKETDMAVVVSQGQNEIAEMRDKELDIRPHRKRMVEEDLETKFKNPDDPFRLVFVCAMWMTGFDVPSCSTLYLDKPMRNHTLMQTIARCNRVYPGKVSGLIVDYAGVFRNLEKALAIYGAGRGGDKPVEDKAALVAALRQAMGETKSLCQERGVNLTAIQKAEGFARVGLLDDAVEALVGTEEIKLRYLDLANTLQRLYKAVLPDPAALEFAVEVIPVQVIADKIRALIPPADISLVLQQVEGLLDRSIATEGYIIRELSPPFGDDHWIDLSNIDFEKLAEKFKISRKRTINEQLKGQVAQKLMAMVRLNRTRMDYMERFQAMIDAYNAGSLNAEEFFQQLVDFAKSLNAEEKRAMGEQLNEEELALFDLLTKPQIEMSKSDREKVKATARQLLTTLKAEKLVLDWRKRQQARAEVRVTIEKVLDYGLPRIYTPELFEQKTMAVFQHVYDAYYGAGRSAYATA